MILNSLEIYLIVRRWRKMKPYEQLLLNLAIADFLVGIMRLMSAIHGIHNPDWKNEPYSIVVLAFMQFSVSSSAFNIFAISTDRLMAVKMPLIHRVWMSKRNARIMNASTWILTFSITLACTLLTLFGSERVTFVSGAIMLVIGIAMIIVHVVLVRSVLSQPNFPSEAEKIQFHFERLWERKVVLMCTLFLATYIACTWPACIEIVQCKIKTRSMTFTKSVLVFLNSLIDPCLYFFKDYLRRKHRHESTNGNLNDKL